jgi:hypothetical protein
MHSPRLALPRTPWPLQFARPPTRPRLQRRRSHRSRTVRRHPHPEHAHCPRRGRPRRDRPSGPGVHAVAHARASRAAQVCGAGAAHEAVARFIVGQRRQGPFAPHPTPKAPDTSLARRSVRTGSASVHAIRARPGISTLPPPPPFPPNCPPGARACRASPYAAARARAADVRRRGSNAPPFGSGGCCCRRCCAAAAAVLLPPLLSCFGFDRCC